MGIPIKHSNLHSKKVPLSIKSPILRQFTSENSETSQKQEKNGLVQSLYKKCTLSQHSLKTKIWFYQTSWQRLNCYREKFRKLTFRALALRHSVYWRLFAVSYSLKRPFFSVSCIWLEARVALSSENDSEFQMILLTKANLSRIGCQCILACSRNCKSHLNFGRSLRSCRSCWSSSYCNT